MESGQAWKTTVEDSCTRMLSVIKMELDSGNSG